MSELDNRVNISVVIADSSATREGFGNLAICHKHQQGTPRVRTYSDLAGLTADFPAYTPVGKYASIFFAQDFKAQSIKVIEQEAAENVTAALTAAALEDADWYGIGLPSKTQSEQEEAAAYALSNEKISFNTIADPNAIIVDDTDLGSVLQALSNNRAATWYSGDAGEEIEIDSISVTSTTATATMSGTPPVAVGDKVGIWTSAVSALNAIWTVTAVGALDFDFEVPAGTSDDVASSDAWVSFNLIDAGATGKMLPQDAGSRTWDIQKLSGVTTDNLSSTAQTNLASKNVNWFTTVAGLNVTGGGGKLASGRYIDIQRGADWLQSNLQVDLFELMVNEGGDLGYDALGFQKVETTIALRLNDGLEKGFLTPFVSGEFAGNDWVIQMPNLADIPQSDKTNRLLAGIEIFANIRGKIQNITAVVNLST